MKPKTHLIPAALVAVLLLLCLATPAAAFSGAGSGTEADPYIITTPAQLQSIQDDLTAYYKLGNDIDLSGVSWTPIAGQTSGYTFIAGFSGTLDGDGYTLSGLYVENTNTGQSQTACCFMVLNGGTVKNVKITDFTFRQNRLYAGAAIYYPCVFTASFNMGNIINCEIDADITTISYATNNRYYGTGMIVYGCDVHDCIITGNIDAGSNHISSNDATTATPIMASDDVENVYVSVNLATGNNLYGISNNWINGFSVSNSVFVGTTSKSATGRISNSDYSPILSNNYVINTVLPSSNDANSYNGADVSAATLATKSFYQNTLEWDFVNTWYWDSETNTPQLIVFRDSVPPTISAISATPATGGQLTEYTLTATATTEAAGGIASYQWSYSTDSGQTWTPISGATTAIYIWTPGTSISGAVLLKCFITGADGGTVDSYEAGYTNIQITIIPPPDISTISVSRPLQKVNTPTTLTATLAESEPATYQWYYSTNGGTTWTPISGATAITAEYTPTTTGTHSVKFVVTNQYGESNNLSTNIKVLPTYTPTAITNTSVDINIDSTAKYQGIKQFTLSAELNALNYYTSNLAHLAHDNALYYLDSAEREVIPVSTTTGGTISAAYIGQYTGVITDTAGNTAFYSYQTDDWQYIEQNSAAIIASTSSYAATVSAGTLRIYNLNGNLVASTATTAENLAGNDNTNVFVSYSGKTITYYWYQNGEIKTASQTLGHTITELHQISSTANWIVSTTANTYTISISDTGSYELLSTTDTDTPLIHTQATNINVLIGVAAPNEIYIVGADGETDGTYVTGSTLSDASIAKATGLYAIAGGEDRQAYILAKSTSSTWQLLQTVNFGDNIDYSQISTTGTYAAVSTGLKLYLLEAVDISANSYLLQGVIIGSSGSVWANKPFTINGDNLRTDAAGRFVYSVQPATLYTIVTDTTTTEYTATNAALQTIAIKLKPNPFAQSVSYSTDYNADTRNFEMTYTDTRDMTSSVTWVIRETGNQTIVSTQTVQAGQTAYWEVPLDKSFTSYQISMIADRQGTNVENTWIITPDGKNPINIPGLDETGRTILFGAVLMIFGGLFGVMHSTKGALLTVLLAGVFAYLGLLNIPTTVIMVAATLAVAALLAKGSGGS